LIELCSTNEPCQNLSDLYGRSSNGLTLLRRARRRPGRGHISGRLSQRSRRARNDMRILKAPALAIYALQTIQGAEGSPARVAAEARNQTKSEQTDAFEAGVTGARVVRISDADHYVYVSNEDDVLREIYAFVAGLG
jgi:pimeloyl-ACP methyl ester carboxylesterase